MRVEWGYTKKFVRVDDEAATVTVKGKEVLKVTAEDFVLKLYWLGGSDV